MESRVPLGVPSYYEGELREYPECNSSYLFHPCRSGVWFDQEQVSRGPVRLCWSYYWECSHVCDLVVLERIILVSRSACWLRLCPRLIRWLWIFLSVLLISKECIGMKKAFVESEYKTKIFFCCLLLFCFLNKRKEENGNRDLSDDW